MKRKLEEKKKQRSNGNIWVSKHNPKPERSGKQKKIKEVESRIGWNRIKWKRLKPDFTYGTSTYFISSISNVVGPHTSSSVIFASIWAEVGPRLSLISSNCSGSSGGTSNSGIPSFKCGLISLTDLVMQFAMSGSLALHTWMYSAEKNDVMFRIFLFL